MLTEPDYHLNQMPLVAILRGVTPDEVTGIADALYDAGLRVIEVPLNSPEPFESIRRLVRHFGDKCLVGAGTVTRTFEVNHLFEIGAKLVVSPCTDPQVLRLAHSYGMVTLPGVATGTDVFTAIRAGAKYLKLFPASTYGPGHLKALGAVVPADIRFLAVGGVSPANMAEWMAAGAMGFGLGSDLYKAGMTAAEAGERARKAILAFRQIKTHA